MPPALSSAYRGLVGSAICIIALSFAYRVWTWWMCVSVREALPQASSTLAKAAPEELVIAFGFVGICDRGAIKIQERSTQLKSL